MKNEKQAEMEKRDQRKILNNECTFRKFQNTKNDSDVVSGAYPPFSGAVQGVARGVPGVVKKNLFADILPIQVANRLIFHAQDTFAKQAN